MASVKVHVRKMREEMRLASGCIDQISSLDGARNPAAMVKEVTEAAYRLEFVIGRLVAIQNVANGQLKRRLGKAAR